MTKIFVISTLIIMYISIIAIIIKDSDKKVLCLIPGFNIYLFLNMLGLSKVDMLILLIGIIIPFTRPFMIPFTYILISFMIPYAMEKSVLFGLLFLCLPFISYPLLAMFR